MHPNGKQRSRHRKHEAPVAQNILSAAGAPPGTFPVIDPFSKKLFIPVESMIDTRAMHREGVPSLCRIFLQGRCRQGANCFQAHADNETVLRLRAAALAEPSCCPRHGAPDDSAGLMEALQAVIHNDEGQAVARLPVSQVCVTNGLHALLVAQGVAASPVAPEVVVVPLGALCRLHSGHGRSQCCRFGAECNFVHICREVNRSIEERSKGGSAVVSPTPNPSPDTPAAPAPATNSTRAVEVSMPPPAAHQRPLLSPPQHQRPPVPLETGATAQQRMGGSLMGSSVMVPMSASAGWAGTPQLNFDPLALAATAPSGNEVVAAFPLSTSPVRSFSSTPNGLVWRHNPYGSSKTSSVIET